MKFRYVLLLVLLSNLGLLVYGIFWIAENEPHPLEIQGEAYPAEALPFIAQRVAGLPVPSGDLIARLVLIGDAGDPAEINLENLAMLQQWSQAYPDRTISLYLGDNVYSYGFEPDKQERSEAILSAQLAAGGARKIVIPGNHDWGHSHGNLVERIIAQQDFVDAWPGGEFYPRNGCPGPEVVPLIGEELGVDRPVTLIVVDTQWFISPLQRPDCDGLAFYEVMMEMEGLLEQYQAHHVIVASHHPIRTTGPHGGFKRELLRNAYHSLTGSQGTLGKPLYRAVMGDYAKALGSGRPLLYAVGHEHSLQLHEGGDIARYLLVSGAGAVEHVNTVTAGEDTLFAHAHAGFTVIDFLDTGNTTAMVLRMVEAGKGEVFAVEL